MEPKKGRMGTLRNEAECKQVWERQGGEGKFRKLDILNMTANT